MYLPGWEFETDKSRYGVYVTHHCNWMNSYWMFWIGRLRAARSVSSSAIFEKMTFRDLTAFFSFLMWENLVFQIFLLRSIKFICVQILLIDFSEASPWKVISFFWRSVYINLPSNQRQIRGEANPQIHFIHTKNASTYPSRSVLKAKFKISEFVSVIGSLLVCRHDRSSSFRMWKLARVICMLRVTCTCGIPVNFRLGVLFWARFSRIWYTASNGSDPLPPPPPPPPPGLV